MHEKHTDLLPRRGNHNAKGMKKQDDKEHGKTLKDETPRIINHKATRLTILQSNCANR